MWWGRGRVRGRPATTWGWAKSEDLRGLHRRTRLWFRGRLRRLWVVGHDPATPNLARCSVMNRQINGVAGRTSARRKACGLEDLDGLRELGVLPLQFPDLLGRLRRHPPAPARRRPRPAAPTGAAPRCSSPTGRRPPGSQRTPTRSITNQPYRPGPVSASYLLAIWTSFSTWKVCIKPGTVHPEGARR